jgi:hypothetical protein
MSARSSERTGAAYAPRDGVLVLGDGHLRALLARRVGRAFDPCVARELDAAGLLVDGGVDPAVEPILDALVGSGPRFRLVTRVRGAACSLTAAVGEAGAALVVRPPADGRVHLRYLSVGGLARHLARRVGVGSHVGGRPSSISWPLAVAAWGDVVGPFRTASPSGWATGRRVGELHELRWVVRPGDAARTALVTAVVDGELLEVRPDPAGAGYLVGPADPLGLWVRISELVSGGPARCGQPPRPPRRRGAGPEPL